MKPNENIRQKNPSYNHQFTPQMVQMAPLHTQAWPQHHHRLPMQQQPQVPFQVVYMVPPGVPVPQGLPGFMSYTQPPPTYAYPTAVPPPAATSPFIPVPLQTVPKVETSSKQSRAVPIIDPKTGCQVRNENAPSERTSQIKLNTEVDEFVPGSKRTPKQQQAGTSAVMSQEIARPLEVQIQQSSSMENLHTSPSYRQQNYKHRHNNSYRGRGHNPYKLTNRNNYTQKADKEVSTHYNSQHHQSRGNSHGSPMRREPFPMPPLVPPYQNKETTAKPSVTQEAPQIVEDPVPASVEIVSEPEESVSVQQEETSSESSTESQIQDTNVTEKVSEVLTEEYDSQEEQIIEKTENEIVIDEPITHVPEFIEPISKKGPFFRYSSDELRDLKIGNPFFIKSMPSDHPMILRSFRGYNCIFIKDVKEEPSNRKHNHSFGKSSQLTKRNSGELRQSESFTYGRQDRQNNNKGGSPKHDKSGNMNNNQNNIIRVCLSDVKLNESQNAWKPTLMKTKENISDEERKVLELRKAFRLLLNKMTEDNYDLLIKDVQKMKFDNMEKLEAVVNVLFEKSITEPGYASMYAKLCSFLASIHTVEETKKDEKCKTRNTLKKCLISRCQQEFVQANDNNDVDNLIDDKIEDLKALQLKAQAILDELKNDGNQKRKLSDELGNIQNEVEQCDKFFDVIMSKLGKARISKYEMNEDEEINAESIKKVITLCDKMIEEFESIQGAMRHRSKGTVKFIGELFKANMLTINIMNTCINSLFDTSKLDDVVEDNIERLCKLLSTIGRQIDETDRKVLNNTFVGLKKLLQKNTLKTTRIRFEVMNIVDLRATNWEVRVNQRSSEICPMKLNDFAQKLRMEEQKKVAALEEYDHDRRNKNNQGHGNQHHGHHQQQQQQHGGRDHRQNNNNRRDNHRDQNNRNNRSHGQKYQEDSEGFVQRIDFSRMPQRWPTNQPEIRLGPANFENFIMKPAQQGPPQQQPFVQRNANPFSQLDQDSDGSEAYRQYENNKLNNSRGNGCGGSRNNGNGRGRNQGKYQQQQQQQQQQPQPISYTILHRNPNSPIKTLRPMSEIEFPNIIKACCSGGVSLSQLVVKMQGYSLSKEVLGKVLADFCDRNELDRRTLMKCVLELEKEKIISKNLLMEAFCELMEIVPDLIIDIPLVYRYIEQYFEELLKEELLCKDDIVMICKPFGNVEKFASLLSSTSEKQEISQIDFTKNIKAYRSGALTAAQIAIKLEEYQVSMEVLSTAISSYFDHREDDRRDLMKCFMELEKEKVITKELLIAAFNNVFEYLCEFILDLPHVYKYIEEYFSELLKHEFFSKDELAAICKTPEEMEKLSTIFADEEATLESVSPESLCFLDSTILSPESGSSSSSSNLITCESTPQGSQTHEEKLKSVDSAISSKLCDDNFLVPPAGVEIGSYATIKTKVEYAIRKVLKKPNLDSLITLIEDQNCKYENTFIAELTKSTLTVLCEKVKAPSQAHKCFGSSLQLIKRYVQVNDNLKPQLYCISAIQAYVYGNKQTNPELLKAFLEVFYEQEVISYDALKIWYHGLSDKAKNDKFVKSTNEFFSRLESGEEGHELSQDFNCTSSTVKDN